MTTQLIRMVAKERAGEFYEEPQRSLRFRQTWPNQRRYVETMWPSHVQEAKARLIAYMLRADTPQREKDVIEEELIENSMRGAHDIRARDVLQATRQPREREDIKHIDATPLLKVAD